LAYWRFKSLTVGLRCFLAALVMATLAATPIAMPEAQSLSAETVFARLNGDEPVICSQHSHGHGHDHQHDGQHQCSGCLLCATTDVAAIPLQDVTLPTASRIEDVRYVAASQLVAAKPVPTNRQARGPPHFV
jgi:hypothetical protein